MNRYAEDLAKIEKKMHELAAGPAERAQAHPQARKL